MWNLRNNIKEQTKQKQAIVTENRLMAARAERGFAGLGEKGEVIGKYRLVLIKQSRGCKVQHRNYGQ